MTKWQSDQVTKWPSDRVTDWPSDRVTEWLGDRMTGSFADDWPDGIFLHLLNWLTNWLTDITTYRAALAAKNPDSYYLDTYISYFHLQSEHIFARSLTNRCIGPYKLWLKYFVIILNTFYSKHYPLKQHNAFMVGKFGWSSVSLWFSVLSVFLDICELRVHLSSIFHTIYSSTM